uniref:Cytochrome P450 n=1 Tax=Tetradesmus obliquus TaxID=3088 RepID=A0A383VRC8_TETOB|eukprot:jgi/Sobl393_1/2445/SZX68067.1
MHHSQTRPKPTATSNSSSLCHSRPSCSSRHATVVLSCKASSAPAAQYEPVPAVRGGLPYIGVLHRTPVNQLFSFVEREFAETGVRCLDLQVFGRHAVYTRHPEDIGSVLHNPSKWTKAPLMMKRLDRWLGEGLVSELDPARHAAARDVLAPAFRAQSVKDLVPLFADVGQQLAAALLSQAGSTIELEPITRRATLDVIGRAGFGHDFGALQMAQQQQQQQDQVDIVKLFDDILDTSMLLIMNPPLPDALVPGHSSYCAAVDALEAVALRLLQERRQQGISPQNRSLLSFMLAAQQAAPGGLVSDKHIRDQLMTFMLAGSDTSATSLAFCLYELARRPQAQQAVRQELQQVLEDTPIDQLQPDAFSSLPYLTGCINECLRLYPAAPGLARIPQQDAVLGPHLVPQGLPVVVDFFSCHRHPEFWPRASEWLPERWLPSNLKALGPQHPDAFMPFSAGSRSCIGRYFAMLEMQVMLAVVLRQLSFAAVGGEGSGQAAAAQSFTLKSRDGLRVVPTAAGR